MQIIYNENELEHYVNYVVDTFGKKPILIALIFWLCNLKEYCLNLGPLIVMYALIKSKGT